MFKAVPFQEIHAEPLLLENINKGITDGMFEGYLTALRQQTESYTFMVNDDVIAVAGIAKLWAGRGYLWMILSENIKKHPVESYRGLRKFLYKMPYRRVEMDVPINTEFDDRRARFMGFRLECSYARSYSPTGEDRAIYAWVRD